MNTHYLKAKQHRQVWLSLLWGALLLSLGFGAHKVLFVYSKQLWRVWGLILSSVEPSYHLAAASPLPLDMGTLNILQARLQQYMN